MKWGIDLNQASTMRGLIWVIGGMVAIAFLTFSSQEKALAAISITASIAGGFGVTVKD